MNAASDCNQFSKGHHDWDSEAEDNAAPCLGSKWNFRETIQE